MVSVTFFCPTSGGDKDVDTAKVTQALERLREGSEIDYFSKLNSLGHTNSSTPDPPSEIIMICLDSSASMDSSADFPDMQGSQSNVQIKEEPEDELRNPLPRSNVAWSADGVRGSYLFTDKLKNESTSLNPICWKTYLALCTWLAQHEIDTG